MASIYKVGWQLVQIFAVVLQGRHTAILDIAGKLFCKGEASSFLEYSTPPSFVRHKRFITYGGNKVQVPTEPTGNRVLADPTLLMTGLIDVATC